MKLDANKLRAEADAHLERLQGPLWSPPDGDAHESWTSALTTDAEPREQPPAAPPQRSRRSASGRQDNQPEESDSLFGAEHRPQKSGDAAVSETDVLAWLERAAGNPRSYDIPDGTRISVCARILPSTYRQLQAAQRRLKLRTRAGTWEYVMRLGLSAAERLKKR